MSVEDFLSRLRGVRKNGAGRWRANCPAHDSNSGSLAVREAEDGKILVHCHVGCSPADVVDAVGMKWADLMPYHLRALPERREPYRASEIDRQIQAVIGYLNDTDHDRVVVDIYRIMRKQGVTTTREDRERVRQAYQALAAKGIAA